MSGSEPRARAGVVIVEGGRVVLIERHRAGMHYFTIPGGGVEPGETPEQAAVREAREELGLDVRLEELFATFEYGGPQRYYRATVLGGEFGTGFADEPKTREPERWGTYKAVWVPLEELATRDVRPRELAALLEPGSD